MSIIIGGGTGGVGGAGFTLGPQQNVFVADTKALAESAVITYGASNPTWLLQYNDDTSLNIRLEYQEAGEQRVTYQVRNSAGDTWLDNESFKGVKGDKGDTGDKGDDGVVQSIVAGNNVNVDSSDPANPIVSSTSGGFDPSGLSPDTVPVVNSTSTNLIDSSITETDTNIVMTKTLIVPQESLQVGPALTVSDKGGNLGLANKAEGYDSFVAVNRIYETEAERDAIFPDGVPKIKYEYLVPAKWVYQFPFDTETSDDNYLSFELADTDNTYVRKIRLFSESARTGVRIWIENLLPTGDQLVWENVSEKAFNDGKGDDLNSSGFSEIEIGLIKISTANIPFRFNIQAQAGEKLNIRGTKADIGFGEGFYPKLYTYTQDSLDVEALDAVDTSAHRFGDFDPEFRIDSEKVVVRDKGRDEDVTVQGVFDTAITDTRPVVEYVNGSSPVLIRGIKVKHTGTWSPVQVSFSDLRTTSVNLVNGDNTIQIDGNPLTLEANETLKVTFTGAVGTGSQTQISLLGDSSQKPYAVLETTTITVKGVGQVDSVVAGNKISIDSTDPENPIINWSPARDETVSNFAGIFENTTSLLSKYPSPPDGLYANVLQGNGDLPDDRYESENGQWIGKGGISGRVIVDNVKSLGITTGEGLKYEDDGGSAKISLSGNTDVINLDMSLDSTRTLDAGYVGKIANLIQSDDISVTGQISLVDHANFTTGDVITITASDTYLNYFFSVYYNEASGRQRASYPSNKITLTRTDAGWDVSLDGRFTNVMLVNPSSTTYSGDPIVDNAHPVSGFVFVDRSGVEFITDDSGKELLKVDIGAANNTLGFNVDHANAGEVIVSDGSNHDVVAIDGSDNLVLGSRSESVKTLHLATGDTTIGVYRKDETTGDEIVDRVVMASELEQFEGVDNFWVEGAKTDGQILKGNHPEKGEMFAGPDDFFMWKYSDYVYMMPLAYVIHHTTVNTQAGIISYTSGVERFTLNASSAGASVTSLGWTIGGGTGGADGEDVIPVEYHNLLTSANTIAAATYPLTGANSPDLFTFQWNSSQADTLTIPLAIVPENGEYILGGTSDRVKLVHSVAGYELVISNVISDIGFMGYTTGYNQGSTVINAGKGRDKTTLYLREASYTITEEDIQNDIIIQAEPFVQDGDGFYSTTVTFPDIDTLKKYYYIPKLNEQSKNTLPHIENLNIQCWIDPESTRKDIEHRLYLKSTGNSIAWETTEKIGDENGCFIHRPANDTERNVTASFNFMKLSSGSEFGPMLGYAAQTSNADHVYAISVTPPAPPIVRDNAENVTYYLSEGNKQYESIDREYPVILSEDVVNGQLLRMTKAGSNGVDLPHAGGIHHAGEIASGIARESGSIGEEIQSVTSGTFSFENAYSLFGDEFDPQSTIPPYRSIYVSRSSGKLTSVNTGHLIGWTLEDNKVLLDIDMYNAGCSEIGDGSNGFSTHFATTSSVNQDAGTGVIDNGSRSVRNFLFDYDHALTGITLEPVGASGNVPVAVKGVFPAPQDLPISDENAGDIIVLDSITNKINWPSLANAGSIIIGWYAGDNKVWIDVEMYNRFRDIERLASGGEIGDTISVEAVIDKDNPENRLVFNINDNTVLFADHEVSLRSNNRLSIKLDDVDKFVVNKNEIDASLDLNMNGNKVHGVAPAVDDDDLPNWVQVKDYVAANGGGGSGSGDISWVGNISGNHGLVPYIQADDGKTLTAGTLTYGDISASVTLSNTNKSDIDALNVAFEDLAGVVSADKNDLTFLHEDIDKQFEFDHVTTLEALGITDSEIHAVHGDKEEIAKIFKTGEVRDGNKYILTLNQFVGKDLHGFLPTNFGGVLKVTSAHSYTHRDPSMTQEQLPPFKEHRVLFDWFDVTGGYYSAILDQDDAFSGFSLVSNDSKVDDNALNIVQLRSDVDFNVTDIENLGTTVGDHSAQISQLTSDNKQLEVEVTKIENIIGVPSTNDINNLGITEQQVMDANGDVETILRLFRNAKLYGSTSEYHFVGNVPDGNDFYGFLPDNKGGVFSIVQYVGLSDPDELYTIAQYINDSNLVQRAVISFSDTFDGWGAHSGGDSLEALRQEFEKYKTITDATLTRLEETLSTMQTLLDTAFNHQSLSFVGNTLTSTMRNIKGEYSDATVFVDASSGGEVPDDFTVYIGWDSNKEVTAEEILDLGTDGKTTVNSSKTTLMTDTFTTTRTLADNFDYKFTYIAYPKGAVDPEPDKVEYNGFPAIWDKHEILLEGMTYVVMTPQYANVEGSITMTLVQS